MCGLLGDIVRKYNLQKTQVVVRQFQNYKKKKFMNMQVSILLNPSDLDERLHEGTAMPTSKFMSSTLARICDPDFTLTTNLISIVIELGT
jgi:hypothetical protein